MKTCVCCNNDCHGELARLKSIAEKEGETPRTDAEFPPLTGCYSQAHLDWYNGIREKYRQLERELAEANRMREQYSKQLDEALFTAAKLAPSSIEATDWVPIDDAYAAALEHPCTCGQGEQGEISCPHCNRWEKARRMLKVALSASGTPSWIEEELKDGDRICEAAGVQRTEGGRLPVQKIINAIKGRLVTPHRSGGPDAGDARPASTRSDHK